MRLLGYVYDQFTMHSNLQVLVATLCLFCTGEARQTPRNVEELEAADDTHLLQRSERSVAVEEEEDDMEVAASQQYSVVTSVDLKAAAGG